MRTSSRLAPTPTIPLRTISLPPSHSLYLLERAARCEWLATAGNPHKKRLATPIFLHSGQLSSSIYISLTTPLLVSRILTIMAVMCLDSYEHFITMAYHEKEDLQSIVEDLLVVFDVETTYT